MLHNWSITFSRGGGGGGGRVLINNINSTGDDMTHTLQFEMLYNWSI